MNSFNENPINHDLERLNIAFKLWLNLNYFVTALLTAVLALTILIYL